MTSTLTKLKIYVLDPSYSLNMITNPSIELGTTGYTGSNATLARVSTYSRREQYSLAITPSSASKAFAYTSTGTLTSGSVYSAGVDFLGWVGVPYSMEIYTTGAAYKTEVLFNGNGYWQRKYLTWTADANAAFRLQFAREANANVDPFYIDGVKFEPGLPSSYHDGNSKGFFPSLNEYYWQGAPHASQSVREASTRSGGLLTDLQTYIKKIGIQGLGLPGFTINATPIAQGGEIYQNTHLNARDFSILYAMDGVNIGDFYTKIKALVKLFNPKRMKMDQPLRLYIVGLDDNGLEQSDGVFVDCHYKSGLEINETTPSFTRGAINLRMSDPIIKADGDIVIPLPATADAPFYTNYPLGILESSGTAEAWNSMGDRVTGIFPLGDGSYYIYGWFTGGITTRLADGSLLSVGTGANGYVNVVAKGVDGYFYFGGSFSTFNGNANCVAITKFLYPNATPLGTGLYYGGAGNAIVYGILNDNLGNIYVGGRFDKFNGVGGTTCNNFAKFNLAGGTWSVCGAGTPGVTGEIDSMAFLPIGKIVLAGNFTNAGGTSGLNYIAWFDGTNYGSFGTAPDGYVSKVLFDSISGYLYAFGGFTTIGGVSTPGGAAYFDGTNWHPMPGLNSSSALYCSLMKNGFPYILGDILINGSAFGWGVAWDGTAWHPLDVYRASGNFRSLQYDSARDETFYMMYGVGAAPKIPSIVTINNSSEENIYPRVIASNAGYYFYSLHNRSTNEKIYLDGLSCGLGESIEFTFTKSGFTVISNIRGDLKTSILPGSSPTFHLKPGTNYVSCFIAGNPNGSPAVVLRYPAGNYTSLYETVR